MIDFNNKEKTKKLLSEKADLLKTIAHPVRLCMQCCLDVPQPTVSQHLAKLKSAGILSAERNGTEIIYTIKNEEVKKLIIQILKD